MYTYSQDTGLNQSIEWVVMVSRGAVFEGVFFVKRVGWYSIYFAVVLLSYLHVAVASASTPHPVDWVGGKIIASGMAVPSKKKVGGDFSQEKLLSDAKVVAQKRLLEDVKQIPIFSSAKVGTMLGENTLAMAKIQDLIKKAPLVNQAYLSDGTLKVTIEMALWGAFLQLVLPAEVKPIETIVPIPPLINHPDAAPNDHRVTGLIIDSRGLALTPALVPSIIDDRGEPLYGPKFINRDFAVQWGMCAYTAQINKKMTFDRVGGNPFRIKALRSSGPQQTDIVISSVDASRIRALAEHLDFLREGRIIVVIDSER